MLNNKGSTMVLVMILTAIIPVIALFALDETIVSYKLLNSHSGQYNAESAAYSGLVFASNNTADYLEGFDGIERIDISEEKDLYFTLEYLEESDVFISTGYYREYKYEYYFRK